MKPWIIFTALVGILLLPLIVFGLFRAFGGRRGQGRDPVDRSPWLTDWHQVEHERMAGVSGTARPAAAG